MEITACILDADTMISKSKPEIPIINQEIPTIIISLTINQVFTIKISLGISSSAEYRNFCLLFCAIHPLF